MDLFPKDYRKNDSAGVTANSKPATGLGLKNTQDRFSILRGNGGLFLTPQTKNALARWGIILSAVALTAVLAFWGGLMVYKKSLVGQIGDLKKQQENVFSDRDKKIAAEIVAMEKGSALTQDLLKSHIYASGFFEKLSAATVPRVQWQSLNLAVADRSAGLKGFAADYATLAKQILLFRESGFTNIAIDSIALDKNGGVGFGAVFNFDIKVLQK